MDLQNTPSHIVDGLRLPRPFQVRRLGHFGINVESVARSLDFFMVDCSVLKFLMSLTLVPECLKR